MKRDLIPCRSAEVNGTKTKSLRCRRTKCPIDSKRAEQGKSPYSAQKSYIGVFSDDFATVDVREELCYHSLTEKANSEEIILLLECKKLT